MIKVYMTDVSNLPDPKNTPQTMVGLPKERKEKILRYIQPEDRRLSLGAGLLLKYVLLRYGVEYKNIRYGENGKPMLDDIYFNLSHAQDMAVCAVSNKPVGCDVEKIEKAPMEVAERFFYKKELEYLRKFQAEEQDQEFFRLWTIKESYMKMTGEGMSLPLDQFEVSIHDSVQIYRNGEKCDCSVKEYEIPGYKCAVCGEEDRFAAKTVFVEF